MSSQENYKSLKRKRGPTYREAHKRAFRLFDEGKTVPETYKILQREFTDEEIPGDVRQVYSWQTEYRRNKVIQEGIETLVKKEIPTDKEPEPLIEESESIAQHEKQLRRPSSLRDKELPKPPSLTELIEKLKESGVPNPKKLAPELLADWDIAFGEDDYLRARTCERAVAILKEVPGIPYKKALGLGNFEAKLEYFEIDGLKEGQEIFKLINIYKRYRPWDGRENQKAYQKMSRWWFEKTQPLRDKLRSDVESKMRSWLNISGSKEEGK